ncbi:hypothetical protein Q31b_21740 [Novipirellula aureliae]|uniref:Uncharacterized protein n=1 Tax=Novipirellula aureliae TaxID=2527966 RepID=A0A5C6E6Q0_9BACT|nr:hypothetical protein [Novipirellula aureliae]TWU43136.1 hypothetical protein Q31b_21740 [Novipirellula aureliae]
MAGEIERYHRTTKCDWIRLTGICNIDDARRAVTEYVTPYAKLAGKEKKVITERDRKLAADREERRRKRSELSQQAVA